MQWLTPMTAVYAGAAALSTLVLLYILKLKRHERVISSTLLWRRASQDLQVNAPFRRLRRNLLMLLQLLVLLALLFALAGPFMLLNAGPAKRYVLLIDHSASMNAKDGPGGVTRLAAAKAKARELVESMRTTGGFSLTGQADQAMVVAFTTRAKVLCNFTSDQRQILAAIDAVKPTDGGSSLSEAINVARAFAQSPGEDANNRSAEQPASLALFSDGRIGDLEQIIAAQGELAYYRVGQSNDNVAVVAMQGRRSYEDADVLDVFTTLANYGPAQVSTDVQLSINGDVRSVRTVRVPAATAKGKSQRPAAGRASVSFQLTGAPAGVLAVKQLRGDVLACDDEAWSIVPPPKRMSVLLVTSGNVALSMALKACPLAQLDEKTPQQFDALDPAAVNVERTWDVIVLDGHAPEKLPRGRYLVFGPPPKGIDVKAEGKRNNQVMVDWRPRHPVLQYVNLTNFFCSTCEKLTLPRDAEVLAEFADCPAMAVVRRHGSAVLLVSFDVLQTNWPFETGFVMFCYNAVRYLGLELGRGEEKSLRVAQPILAESLPPDAQVTLAGPQGKQLLRSDAAGRLRYPATHRVGVYRLAFADGEPRSYAVNLLDDAESDIAPVEEIEMSGTRVQARSAPAEKANVAIWPYLVGLALLLVCVEWLLYNSKLRL